MINQLLGENHVHQKSLQVNHQDTPLPLYVYYTITSLTWRLLVTCPSSRSPSWKFARELLLTLHWEEIKFIYGFDPLRDAGCACTHIILYIFQSTIINRHHACTCAPTSKTSGSQYSLSVVPEQNANTKVHAHPKGVEIRIELWPVPRRRPDLSPRS